MDAPLSTLFRSIRQIIVPIGIVVGIAGATAGLAERRRKKR